MHSLVKTGTPHIFEVVDDTGVVIESGPAVEEPEGSGKYVAHISAIPTACINRGYTLRIFPAPPKKFPFVAGCKYRRGEWLIECYYNEDEQFVAYNPKSTDIVEVDYLPQGGWQQTDENWSVI
jgi:hypothetical protein